MATRLKRASAGLVALVVLVVTRSAWAADVVLEGQGVVIDAARLRTLVTLELGRSADAQDVRVTVRVDGERARVLLTLPGMSPPAGEIDLHGSGDPERTIALLVGVLATTPVSSTEIAAEPPQRAGPGDANGAPRAFSNASEAPSRHFYGLASLDLRLLVRVGALTTAPRVEAGVALPSWGRAGVVVRYTYASADDALGTIDTHGITGGPSMMFRLLERGRFTIGAGPRAELGVAFASGHGVLGRNTSGEVLVGAAATETTFALAPIRVVVGLEGGWARAAYLSFPRTDVSWSFPVRSWAWALASAFPDIFCQCGQRVIHAYSKSSREF